MGKGFVGKREQRGKMKKQKVRRQRRRGGYGTEGGKKRGKKKSCDNEEKKGSGATWKRGWGPQDVNVLDRVFKKEKGTGHGPAKQRRKKKERREELKRSVWQKKRIKKNAGKIGAINKSRKIDSVPKKQS